MKLRKLYISPTLFKEVYKKFTLMEQKKKKVLQGFSKEYLRGFKEEEYESDTISATPPSPTSDDPTRNTIIRFLIEFNTRKYLKVEK